MFIDLNVSIFGQIQEALILEQDLNTAPFLRLDVIVEVDGIAQYRWECNRIPLVRKKDLTLDGGNGAYGLAFRTP